MLGTLSRILEPKSSFIQVTGFSNGKHEFSDNLREGIASSLALMSALSYEIPFISNHSGQDVAHSVVSVLFEEAKTDASLWASFAPQLMLLAEADPSTFLDAVDAGLGGEEPLLRAMFTDVGDDASFGPTSPHTYLIWALETLTWNVDVFGRAVLALANLTKIDPGGKTGNRPGSSLSEIFVVWYPNTVVGLERRLNVLDMLIKRVPTVAWKLLLDILPTTHGGVCHPVHGPKWHDWKPDEERDISNDEVVKAIEEIWDRLLVAAGSSASRWVALIERSGDVWPELRRKMLYLINQVEIIENEEKLTLINAIRVEVNRHRESLEAHWAMPEDDLVILEEISLKLQPSDPVLQHRWLFQRYVPMPNRRNMDWKERDESIAQLRAIAIEEILSFEGWPGVERLAAQVEVPDSIGVWLSAKLVPPVNVDTFLAECLGSPSTWRAAVAYGWISSKAWSNDTTWIDERMKYGHNVWNVAQYGQFMLALPFNLSVVKQLDSSSQEVQQYFWKNTRNARLLNKKRVAEKIIKSLLGVGRAVDVIKLIHWETHDSPDLVRPSLILQVLELAIFSATASEISEICYESSALIDHLIKKKAPHKQLVKIEWLYMGLHEHYRRPKLLQEELARSPEFFVEVLTVIYKPRPADTEICKDSQSEEIASLEPENAEEAQIKAHMAKLAWSLLWHWHGLPGLQEGETVDEGHLKDWVKRVIDLARKNHRHVVALIHVGQVLAHSPRDKDGAWPHKAVRDIIDAMADVNVESGFQNQVFNNRGVTMRSLTSGGAQERALASGYETDAIQISDMWPRTAAILHKIAAEYRRYGDREDLSAELNQDLWK